MSGAIRVALATSVMGLARDTDLPLIAEALRERGVEAVAVPWDDDGFDWSGCAAAVVRSTWGYADDLARYLAWADKVAAVTRLDNPAPVVRWNTDKHYLRELVDRGVPVVETRFIAPGEDIVLPERGRFVVKPTVSAGARDTAQYAESHHDAAARHVAALHAAGSTAMVQPYLSRIDEGERALVFIGGTFSHAMRKGPVLTDVAVIDNQRVAHPGLVPHEPSAAELELAHAALATVAVAGDPPSDGRPRDARPTDARPRDALLYARVDMALADDGSPVVMELELVEPNLFLTHHRPGLARLADAVRDRVRPA